MSTKNYIDDGGAAFSCPEDASWTRNQGMSLRDYMAAKAMQGDLAARENGKPRPAPKTVAEYAYRVADAMISAGGKNA